MKKAGKTSGLDGVAVIVIFKGQAHQVRLTKDDEHFVINALKAMFMSSGRRFEICEEPLTGLTLKNAGEVDDGKEN